jgi:hypothetical protein
MSRDPEHDPGDLSSLSIETPFMLNVLESLLPEKLDRARNPFAITGSRNRLDNLCQADFFLVKHWVPILVLRIIPF